MKLRNIEVINANAISSPYTIGIPAVTAFMGFAHKLQRILNSMEFNCKIDGCGIVVHSFKLHTYREKNYPYYSHIIAPRKPLKKTGDNPSTIAEGKIDFKVSLVLKINDVDECLSTDEKNIVFKIINDALNSKTRIAGGDIISFDSVTSDDIITVYGNDEKIMLKYIRALMPGFALIERRDILKKEMQSEKDIIKSLIANLSVNYSCKEIEGRIEWEGNRKNSGWIVPVSCGYLGLTKPQIVKGSRKSNFPFLYVENLVTLAEYKIVSRIKDLANIIWSYKVDLDNGIYACGTGKDE